MNDATHLVQMQGLAVCRHAHHLVLVVIAHEPQVLGDGPVEETQRVRQGLPLQRVDRLAMPVIERGGLQLCRAVDDQNRRIVKAAGVIGRGRVAQMVIECLELEVAPLAREVPLQRLPRQHHFAHACAPAAGKESRQVAPKLMRPVQASQALLGVMHQALYQPTLSVPVIGHMRNVSELETSLSNDAFDGTARKFRRVLFAREALFFGRRDHAAINHQRGAGVMKAEVEAKNDGLHFRFRG